MRFNPKARIDTGQVENRSGGGGGFGGGLGGSGMRIPIPSGGGGRVGLGTVVVVIIYIVIQAIGGNSPLSPLTDGSDGTSSTVSDHCQTGEDANRDQACAIDLLTNSIQNYWAQTLPDQQGTQYVDIKTVKFRGSTSSGCGRAVSAMGPFYCPNDQRVYIDLDFMDDMLTGQLGAEGGPFALGYVLAHEYGHHIEDQLGILGQMRTQQGPRSDSVKAELMADCLGGMWAKDAQKTTDALGQMIISDLTPDDISRAINAAQSVGDDRIQKESGGKVNPEQWTHGSAAQREHWFNTGLKEGSLEACDTFAPGAL
ncbi:KPN_02809 family neutral zinc metallopeptidase [Nocardioides marmorisolisilvae]|uniref:Peptidase n=1 Tax=Nocardioides marmorisolisilvae TaxID=1542737 RepID=A0A3N0DUV2_9ACTN|nr:neutral zinc metallopeptidase [Nocardioides marmorisolisilvae]RNL79409.1 peptidase [Nocardioides marmorisolisilvae]